MKRIQANLLARPERRLLDRLCRLLAGRITPDQFTLTGLGGAALVFLAGIFSRQYPACLWLIILGLLIHWLGDSLDGSMARYLRQERPRFGYFADHSADALGNLLIMAGFGATAFVRLDAALLAICGYFMLSIYVFLRQHVLGELQLSFLALGPTELRLCLALLALLMLFAGPLPGLGALSFYDLVIGGAGLLFIALFAINATRTALALRGDNS